MTDKTTKKENNMNIHEKLMNIQCELNAPKNLYNSFGKYSYRSCESILEALKPYEKKYRCHITFDDQIFAEGDKTYVQSVVILTNVDNPEETIMKAAPARESDSKKGMDSAQVTGATLSYARKYALGALFALDDAKDADTDENHIENEARDNYRNNMNDPKVGAKEVKQITDFAKQVDVPIGNICIRYQLNTLQDMTMSQFVSVMKDLEATRKSKDEEGAA